MGRGGNVVERRAREQLSPGGKHVWWQVSELSNWRRLFQRLRFGPRSVLSDRAIGRSLSGPEHKYGVVGSQKRQVSVARNQFSKKTLRSTFWILPVTRTVKRECVREREAVVFTCRYLRRREGSSGLFLAQVTYIYILTHSIRPKMELVSTKDASRLDGASRRPQDGATTHCTRKDGAVVCVRFEINFVNFKDLILTPR